MKSFLIVALLVTLITGSFFWGLGVGLIAWLCFKK